MIFHVPSQIGRPPEGLPTLSTFEGPLAGMKSLVVRKLRALVKDFPTHATFVALFPGGCILEFRETEVSLVTTLLTRFKGLLPVWF